MKVQIQGIYIKALYFTNWAYLGFISYYIKYYAYIWEIQLHHQINFEWPWKDSEGHSGFESLYLVKGVRGYVTIKYEYGESNGIVKFDLEWPWKFKVKATQILKPYVA